MCVCLCVRASVSACLLLLGCVSSEVTGRGRWRATSSWAGSCSCGTCARRWKGSTRRCTRSSAPAWSCSTKSRCCARCCASRTSPSVRCTSSTGPSTWCAMQKTTVSSRIPTTSPVSSSPSWPSKSLARPSSSSASPSFRPSSFRCRKSLPTGRQPLSQPRGEFIRNFVICTVVCSWWR